jgi:hypothetical protein
MSWLNDKISSMSQGTRLATGAVLLAVGVAGGASATSLTRPGIEMAPTVVTPIAKLGSSTGIVTIKGRVAEIYGDRALVSDSSGKTMVDIDRGHVSSLAIGGVVLVQGRFDDGQLRASFLVGPGGNVEAIGRGPHGGRRPGPDKGPGQPGPRPGQPGPDMDGPPAACPPAAESSPRQ